MAELLRMLHGVLPVCFFGVTLLFLLVTLLHRWQVKRVRLQWVGRWPLLPTGFLLLVIGLGVYAALEGQAIPVLRLGLYFSGGMFWLAASVLSAQVLVTECGIIGGVSRSERSIGWGQIVDYFPWQDEKGRLRGFVFLFVDLHGKRRRLNLAVPPAQQWAFHQMLERHLDSRFELTMQQCYGKKALEE